MSAYLLLMLLLLPQQVREQAAHPLAQGSFVQSKFLKELPKPIRSKGDFVFSRELGLLWHTRVPFDSELVITSAGIFQREGDGATRTLAGGDQPGVQAATSIFFALFSLDLDALGKDFKITSQGGDPDWQVDLEPRNPATGLLFERAVVRGNSQGIQGIELLERNGDHTEIRLVDVSFPVSLDTSQRSRFKAN